MNTNKFDTNKHSVFLLYYHLILVVKYWSKSYCLLTSGKAPIEMIQKYIKSQGNAKNV